ncbi:MAG: CCA tRNA nucleotidyltransferase, partial [Xanthobacteraceae bacterium]
VGAADPAWYKLADLPVRWTVPVFPLKAADFIQRGIGPGPALGAALRAAEKAWIAADFPAEAATLEAVADQAVRETTTAG